MSPRNREQQLESGALCPLPMSGSPGPLVGGPARHRKKLPLTLMTAKCSHPGWLAPLVQTGCSQVQGCRPPRWWRAEDIVFLVFL